MKRILPVLACLALVTACKETPEAAQARMRSEADAARPVIAGLMARYSRGAALGNADTMLAIYASDAVIMAPNHPVETLDTLRARMARIGPFQVSFATHGLFVNGDDAIERGVFEATMSPPGARFAVVRDGKYLAHWRRSNGEWRIVEHIWNDDYPPPAIP